MLFSSVPLSHIVLQHSSLSYCSPAFLSISYCSPAFLSISYCSPAFLSISYCSPAFLSLSYCSPAFLSHIVLQHSSLPHRDLSEVIVFQRSSLSHHHPPLSSCGTDPFSSNSLAVIGHHALCMQVIQ